MHLNYANATSRAADVRHPRPRVGKFTSCIHRGELMSNSLDILSVWREDTKESEVPGKVIAYACM